MKSSGIKIRTKQFFLVGFMMALVLSISMLGLSSARDANAGLETVYNDRVVPLDQLKKISDMYAVNIVDTCHKVRNGNINWTEALKNINEAKSTIEKNWKDYKNTTLVDREIMLINEIEPLFKAADEATTKAIGIMERKDKDAISLFTIHNLYPAIDPVTDKIDKLIEVQLVVAKEEYAKSDTLYHRNRNISIGIIVLGIIAALGIAFFIINNLLDQLGGEPADVVLIANRLADGDLTLQVNVKDGDRGSILASMKRLVESLEKTVFDIILKSQNLALAVQQISSGNQNLAQRTSEQASSLEEVIATIEETSAAIGQNAENARQANDFTSKTARLAEDGGRVVSEAVMAINEVSAAGKKIEEIITAINEISFQTNLLALNAAVEAARAGDLGRGFAVVAGEVRSLAQRSVNAAGDIGGLIKSTIIKVEKGTFLANKSGEALKEIISSVKDVEKLVSEIHNANDEQKQGILQINTAVTELDALTQQNAGLVEETASASEEMSSQAMELMSAMEKFKINDSEKNMMKFKKRSSSSLRDTQYNAGLLQNP